MKQITPIPWLAALALILATQLGLTCGQSPPPPSTQLLLELENVYPVGSGYLLGASLCVNASQPFQAFDLSVDWQGDSLTMIPVRHPDFDDDDAPFGAPLPAGLTTPPVDLVDLRHATPAPAGIVCLAQLWIYAPNGAGSTLAVSGVLGRPDGSVVKVALVTLNYLP